MENLNKYLKDFIGFHEGVSNKLIHIVGFVLIGIGILQKNIWFVILGGITQEAGHFYQYAETRKQKDNPINGFKSQSIFAIPIFILIIIYVLWVAK